MMQPIRKMVLQSFKKLNRVTLLVSNSTIKHIPGRTKNICPQTLVWECSCVLSRSGVSDPLQSHGL